jgi:hypothetical protein
MSKVFVSYKRVDKEKVFPIVRQMESKLCIKFWMDFEGIESDEQFSNVIVNAINKCEVFLFMYSKSHKNINPKKDWTVREITFADKKEKRIVFIDLDDYELPDWFAFRFPDQQVIKASDSYAMHKLTDDIIKWLHLPQPNPSLKDYGEATDTVSVPKENSSHPQAGGTAEKNPHSKAIDLGLPSGTKWASCNVGAIKPEEFGGYYAWGETKEKTIYNWDTYDFCNGDEYSCSYLGSDIAGSQYDVAHVKWGGDWMMPTLEQFKELLDNCTNERSTLNGVYGLKFTSKINGNSIFLPAGGYRYRSRLYNVGSYGVYWSSTQGPSNSVYASSILFSSGDIEWGHCCYRSSGRTVRPVSRK